MPQNGSVGRRGVFSGVYYVHMIGIRRRWIGSVCSGRIGSEDVADRSGQVGLEASGP